MTHAAGILFLSKEGRVLLLKRSGEGSAAAGTWALPGGKLEEGESAETAALRETIEETGYYAGYAGKILMESESNGLTYTTFLRHIDDEWIPKLNNEHTAYLWMPPEEALENNQLPPAPTALIVPPLVETIP